MGTPSLPVTRGRRLAAPVIGRRRPRPQTVLPRTVQRTVEVRTVRWVGIAALIWRTLTMLVILLLSLGWTERYPGVIATALAVSAANVGLLVVVWLRPRPVLLQHPATFLLDVGVAFGLNVGTSALIRHDTLYAGYPWHDLF